ncbi:MAG: VWA domain-containing protein, partial [Proteobacteria bacterium]|nr:VWA domain-containing protein [Pseudomonadota bacterium]
MGRIIKASIFWITVLGLLGLGIWAYMTWIWWPQRWSIDFTDRDLIEWLNRLPLLNLDVPALAQPYRIMHLEWAGILALWPVFLAFGRRSLSGFPLWQRLLSGIVRIALLTCLVLALIDIEKTTETSLVSVVYVVDVSDSVPDAAMAQAQDEIAKTHALQGAGFDVQLVTYAQSPRIIPLTQGAPPSIDRHDVQGSAAQQSTDIDAALRFAAALFPENHQRRIVLMGDGNQTQGDALAAAVQSVAQDIRIDVQHLLFPPVREVMISGIDVRQRDNLRVSKPFEIVVQIDATHETTARLVFEKNGVREEKNTQDVHLLKGQNFITLTTTPELPGPLTCRISLEGLGEEDDRFAENNVFLDSFVVLGKPKVLYIEQNATQAAYLQRALAGWGSTEGQSFEVEVRTAGGLPTSMRELMNYAAVILGDVPRVTNTGRINVTTDNMLLLQDYVRRQGGGFIAIGGGEAFGLGGYENTPIERILPVSFKADVKKDNQSAAIALVIDKSGSMQAHRNLELAKAAAKATVSSLNPQDRVLVIGFDDVPHIVVPATRAVNRHSINDKISRMAANGGTNIRNALEMTYLELSLISASVKHVILLTDGHSSYAGIDALVREMARARITISTIALQGADTVLLGRIASLGKGKTFIVNDASTLPRIFIEETNRVINNAVIEGPFIPTVARQHAMIQGVTRGTLLGYVATKAKPGAQVILTAPSGAPILAHWSFGTGKTTVFTSDAKNRWATDWIRQSSAFAKFWTQVVRATMKNDEETLYAMTTRIENERAIVSVDAIDDNDNFINALT